MKTYKIRATFREPILGTIPKDKEIYASFIKSKAPVDENADDESETIEEIEEKGWTGFHMVDGQPILYNYVIKGFLKHACGALRRVPKTGSSQLQAYKKVINDLVFVKPRRIPINLNGGEMGVMERPLRGQTPKGERVSLARSDTCPIGSTMEFEIFVMGVVTKKLLCEWLDYGVWYGFGQWRNAEYGSIEYKIS
jgi:hypothetical protein